MQGGYGNYNSGAVVSNIRHAISEQGSLSYTTSATDLAIQGSGFLDRQGRQRHAVPDPRRLVHHVNGANGNLVNSGGYTLMGYALDNGDPRQRPQRRRQPQRRST